MKKHRNNPPKPKEFSASPFSGLKGVKLQEQQPQLKPQPQIRKRAIELDDNDAFLLAMSDVQRLGEKRTIAPKEIPAQIRPERQLVRRIEESEQELFLQTIAGLKLDVKFGDDLPEPSEPLKPRPSSRLKQLRRGTIRLDYELDLHGLTRDEALDALERFVKGAYRRGQQAALVITGRGNHSADEPVLKKAVDKWLKTDGTSMVAESLTAPKELGGEGAVVIFLRKQPEPADNQLDNR